MNTLPERLVLLGHPLGHSLSPVFQNAALRHAGIPLLYESLDVPRTALTETLSELRRRPCAGNVTIPYKEDMLAACHRLSHTASAIGAVNTFWTAVDGALVGDNTDAEGFLAAAKQLLGDPAPGARIGLLGAGGAAAAVLHALEGWRPSEVRVYSRTSERADRLVSRFHLNANVVSSPEDAVRDATIIINATPVGLRGDATPVPVDALPDGGAVLDLAYRAGGTALVRAAQERGLLAQDGMPMLIEQGASAFERWFGVAPDREIMWAAIRAAG